MVPEIEVAEGKEWNPELQEAIALIAGRYKGEVKIGCVPVGVDMRPILRELLVLFTPIGVRVKHEVHINTPEDQRCGLPPVEDILVFQGVRS